jgi:YfiH family protein
MPRNDMLIESNHLHQAGNVRHGFFTRMGGVSRGIYAGLNCGPGSDDDPEAVAENRSRAMAVLDQRADALATLYQIHSAEVVAVEQPFATDARPKADAMVTSIPGIALGVLTADCVPVLFADGEAGVIGAAHAGWKGALYGVVDNTVAAMERLGAARSNIRAAVGPCIRQASYEVGPEFPAAFIKDRQENWAYFQRGDRDGHFQFDLAGYVVLRLQQAGIAAGNIDDLKLDTRDDEERFFSYRRTCLRGEPDYGRQLSAIALPAG